MTKISECHIFNTTWRTFARIRMLFPSDLLVSSYDMMLTSCNRNALFSDYIDSPQLARPLFWSVSPLSFPTIRRACWSWSTSSVTCTWMGSPGSRWIHVQRSMLPEITAKENRINLILLQKVFKSNITSTIWILVSFFVNVPGDSDSAKSIIQIRTCGVNIWTSLKTRGNNKKKKAIQSNVMCKGGGFLYGDIQVERV